MLTLRLGQRNLIDNSILPYTFNSKRWAQIIDDSSETKYENDLDNFLIDDDLENPPS